MKKIHNELMSQEGFYKDWHSHKGHNIASWSLLVLITLLVAGNVSENLNRPYLTGDSQNLNGSSLAATFAARKSRPIPGQYIVQFKDDEKDPIGLAKKLAADSGSEILATYSNVIKGYAAKIPDVALKGLRNNPHVKRIDQDKTISLAIDQVQPRNWGLDRIDQMNLPLNNTYTYNYNGTGVHAYVIDTGIYNNTPEFGNRVGNGFSSINDGVVDSCHWHGSHVAGILGGTTVGVAKNVTLHPVRVLDCNGSGTDSQVLSGMEWVSNNKILPAVANMSMSGDFAPVLNDAIKNLVNMGISVVVAAGNSAGDACNYSPSSELSAITVGATTSGDGQASYSNFGSCVDILAPGSGIYSSMGGTYYGTANGTSMAAPHVAGVAALYLQQNPSATPAQVTSMILSKGTGDVLTLGTTLNPSPNLLLNSLFSGNGISQPVIDSQPPTAPSNLQASSYSHVQVNLNWNASTDNVRVVGYNIYRNSVRIGTSADPNYIDTTPLNPGSTHNYQIEAYDASNNISTPSNSASVTIPLTDTPVDILNYSVTNIKSTSAVISWTTNIPSTGSITLTRRRSSYKAAEDLKVSTTHSVTVTNLNVAELYYYQIDVLSGNTTDKVTGSFKTLRR